MNIAKQLYQLQEADIELESNEQAQRQIIGQLGESQAVAETQDKLTREQQRHEELIHQQHTLEWEIEDLRNRLKNAEDELYSGRIRNPKELTNLQHEIDGLKGNRGQLEDRALEIMDQVESCTRSVADLTGEHKTLKAEWQQQQNQLSDELEQLKTIQSDLTNRRQLLAAGVDSETIEIYEALKKHKGTAVARVEQGICRGCRISLPVNELQRVRSDNLVRCSSCDRVLFLP